MSSVPIRSARESYGGTTEHETLVSMARSTGCFRIYRYANDYGDRTTHTDYKLVASESDEKALFLSRLVHNAVLVYDRGRIVTLATEASAADVERGEPAPADAHEAIRILDNSRETPGRRFEAARFLGRIAKSVATRQPARNAWWNLWRLRASEAPKGPTATPAVDHLRLALRDREWMVRWGAALALGDASAEQAVDDLIRLLNDADDTVVQGARKALETIGSREALEALAKRESGAGRAAGDEELDARDRSAAPQSGIEVPESTERSDTRANPPAETSLLMISLQDPDSVIRRKAAVELHRHPGEIVVSSLIRALKDPTPDVRGAAAESLRLLHDPRAVEPLIELVETDAEDGPVYYAINALGDIRTSRAIEALVFALNQRKGDLSTLAFQLGEARARGAVESLIQLLRDGTPYQRRHAAMALGSIGELAAVEPLEEALHDSDEGVRERARNALNQLRGSSA